MIEHTSEEWKKYASVVFKSGGDTSGGKTHRQMLEGQRIGSKVFGENLIFRRKKHNEGFQRGNEQAGHRDAKGVGTDQRGLTTSVTPRLLGKAQK